MSLLYGAALVVTFDITSGQPVFKNVKVTTRPPKSTLGLMHVFAIRYDSTTPGSAVRGIYRMIENKADFAWVRPYLKVKR